MINLSMNSSDFRLLLPELIELENEDFEQAKEISNNIALEADQWQTYLNMLGVLGLEKWLIERMPGQIVKRDITQIDNLGYLTIKGFKLGLISTEHLLDEIVSIPQNFILNSEFHAHFYVLLEVLEEEEQVLIRGFIQADKLANHLRKDNIHYQSNGVEQIPFSAFDPEPNHLLSYCRLLEPSTIPLSFAEAENSVSVSLAKAAEQLSEHFKETRTELSQWLEGVFDLSWQTIDALISPKANLAFSVRNTESGTRRGKLIDLGMQLGNETFALLVTITKELDNKLGISIQLHPTGEKRYLQPNTKLTLLSKAGKPLQEVIARSQDNYIQLKPFKGEAGKHFSVEVSLVDVSVKEDFKL